MTDAQLNSSIHSTHTYWAEIMQSNNCLAKLEHFAEPRKCLPVLPRKERLLWTQILLPGRKEMLWNQVKNICFSRTQILVPKQMFRSFATLEETMFSWQCSH